MKVRVSNLSLEREKTINMAILRALFEEIISHSRIMATLA
jgi:ribosomal protein L17